MLDQDSITQQLALLAAHRRTLAHLLEQAAAYGGVRLAPSQTATGIAEARANIARIKAALREGGVEVADEPNDDAPPATTATQGGEPAPAGPCLQSTLNVTDNKGTAIGVQNIITQPSLAPALHQLRAPAPDFVGREHEIKHLVLALGKAAGGTAAAATISGVRGMGGIGKTELAYAAAQRLKSVYPEQILVDLRGASDTPATATQALQTAIHAFEREAKLPDDIGELRNVYWSVLAGKKALILADDAKDAAQVRPLLPPTGCALLVTSRNRFALPGMAALDLGTLPPQEAELLLLEICPRIGEHASTLAKLCGYLPLALRVSASLLKSRPSRRVQDYLKQLSDERSRLAHLRDPHDPALDVEASLLLSYTALEQAAQMALRHLSVFAASFDGEAARAVVEVPPSSLVDTVLEDLCLLSLLEYDEALERYSLHELVRAFAAARLGDVETVRLRYARHYAHLADQARTLYHQGGASLLAGLALFDRERTHIDASWGWALARAGEQETDALLLDFADATVYIGDLRYDTRRERIPHLEAQLAAARRLGNRRGEGAALGNLGLAYAALGDAQRAIEFHQQALVIVRELGDQHTEGAVLGNLGIAYADLGDAHKAIDFYQQHLVIDREIGERRGEGAALGNLGLAYAALGDARQAIEFHQQALVIDREIGDRRGEGNALGNLGSAYADLGDAHRAIDFHQQALVIVREIGDRRGEGAVLGNLGITYKNLGDARQAIDFHQQALVIDREIGDRHGEGADLGGLGLAYAALGDVRKAIDFYEQWLGITREIGDRRGEGQALGNLGLAYAALGDARQAIEFHQQALVIDREIGDRRGEGNALGNLGLAYADLGDARTAIDFYEQQLVIAREIGDRRGEGADLGNLGNAYADLGDAQRAIDFHQQRLLIAREIGDRRGEGQTLGNLGLAYADLGDAQRAIDFHQQALVIDRQIGERRGEGADLGNLGLAYAALGDAHQAIEFHQQALVIVRELGDRHAEGAVLGNLGLAYADLGDAQRAIDFFQQHLTLAREIGDRRGEGQALSNLGSAYFALGDARQASDFYQQALVIVREIGDRRGAAEDSWNLGLALEKQGELARAAEAMQVYVDFLDELGHPDAEKRRADLAQLRQRLAGGDSAPGTEP